MAYKKKTGGRQIGTPNKFSKELKDMILQALVNKGGIGYLEKQADDEPVAYMSLLGKVLPLTLSGNVDGKLTVTWEK